MPQSLIEFAKELTLALIQTGNLLPKDVQETLQKTHTTLTALKAQEEFGTATALPVVKTAVDWRKSITKHAVACFECGKTFKQLSTRHLMLHGLDGRSYRAKHGIPRTQPLAAKTTTARRREVVQEVRPWEKSPRFRRAQKSDGKAPPAPEAEALFDEIEEPAAATPAQPKQQRKTTQKKTARKKRSNR